MAECEYFSTYILDIDSKAELEASEDSFNNLLFLEGEGSVNGDDIVRFKKGDSIFITAGTGKYTVNGKCKAVLTKIGK